MEGEGGRGTAITPELRIKISNRGDPEKWEWKRVEAEAIEVGEVRSRGMWIMVGR